MPINDNAKLPTGHIIDLHDGRRKISQSLLNGIHLLITANHILDKNGLVDAFGHISIRHPDIEAAYIIATYNPGAPALVSSRDDFAEYLIEDSTPVFPPQPKGYSERYIHGEIYKRFPNVHCVVHSHSDSVIPLMAAEIPVRPVYHMAGFMGAQPLPVFDAEEYYTWAELDSGDLQPENIAHGIEVPKLEKRFMRDMLIKTSSMGSALAQGFCKGKDSENPDFPVVLQHKHGFTCVGDSIMQAVYRAYYLQKNCEFLKDAVGLAKGDASKVRYLTSQQAKGCAEMNELTQDKAFRLWVHQVTGNEYVNREPGPDPAPVGGMTSS